MSFKDALQTFSFKNVRYLYLGNFTLFLGFWLTFLSILWLVFRLTRSSLSLGLVGLALSLPIFGLLPFAGILADRFSKRKILTWCSFVMLIPPGILAWATFADQASLRLLGIVAPVYGALYALMNPAVDAFIKEVVEQPSDVHRVTGLVSSYTKIAQLFASALSGLLLLFGDVSLVFLSSALFHLLSGWAFTRIRELQIVRSVANVRSLHQFLEGMKYTFSFSPFWSVLMVASTGSLIILAWQWQLPIFAADIIGGGPNTLSLFFLFGGIGGIVGGVYISLRHRSCGLMLLATLALSTIAAGLIGFAVSNSKFFSLSLTFFLDGAWVMLLAATSATLQLIVDDDKRGRVMSFYSMGVFGLMPFTTFLMGVLCNALGVRWGTALVGMMCGGVALSYGLCLPRLRERLFPLYQEKELPEPERPI